MNESARLPNFAVGIFSDLDAADTAAQRLLGAGFSKDDITAMCADEVHEAHLSQLGQAHPSDSDVAGGAAAGASVGAAVGGLAALALGAATGAVPLILAGIAGISGGSAIGGFVGALMESEGKSELARYYDREIRSGRILIAVECQGDDGPMRLERAARILAEAGATFAPGSEAMQVGGKARP